MDEFNEKLEILKKYYKSMEGLYHFYIKEDIPSGKLNNAIKKFASGVDQSTILGFFDSTLFNNGKSGYLFTDSKVYYLEILEKPKKLWYDDIKSVEVGMKSISKDNEKSLIFHLYDGSVVEWTDYSMNKTPAYHFFDELLNYTNEDPIDGKEHIPHQPENFSGISSGGAVLGNYGTVNKLFEEEKFHASQGHGFAAERANNLYDRLTGKNAYIVGDDNAKNGADRVVNGLQIQSKYWATGAGCVRECFENGGNGSFRYYCADGSPMCIEVPADDKIYSDAVEAMKEKIRNGQVKGVTDPEEAKHIVRKGHFTYKQAQNIAKAGTVESIVYDAVTGAITATSALGITAVLTFATSIWHGDDIEVALEQAAFSGIKVGGTAFITAVLAGQLSKAGLNSAMVGSSEAMINALGPKASAILVNAFRDGSQIYGAAAMKSAAKLLRGNVITAGVTIAVLSSFDIANIFRGRISGKQLFKNLTSTVTSTVGGTAGWIGGAAVGSCILPGVGTVVGGLVGAIAAGTAANKATDVILGEFIEDDAEEMVRIIEGQFQELAVDYLLSQKEAEKTVDKLQEKLSETILKDMYANANRKSFARNILVPLIENEISKRRYIQLPDNGQMNDSIRTILEEIYDVTEGVS